MDILAGDYYGYATLYRALGPLALAKNQLFESMSATLHLELDAGKVHAFRTYVILGSATGMDPGTKLPGGSATLPLNWDSFTDLVVSLLNTTVFYNFYGKLDDYGTAEALINAPKLPGLAGTRLHFAYCLNNPFDYV
ncbi:MAG: hypothetical protein ABIK28_02360 [Planctomycetota bacterium]